MAQPMWSHEGIRVYTPTVGHVESHFFPFGDSIIVGAR
jgi:hypothetical protein